ncbi:MAG: DUF2059 domain-containing protein [Armatimonadota bacterium]
MKLRIAIVILAVGLCAAAFAQDEKPPMDLPIYPGAETAMEINMTSEDILPMAKAMLPMLSGKLGPMLDKIDPVELADVFKDVKQIEMVQLDVNNTKVTENDMIGFYAKNIPSGEWNKVFWQSNAKSGTIALYAQTGFEGMYGFRARSIVVDSKPVKRVEVAKIRGKIDYIKLLQMASKLGLSKL